MCQLCQTAETLHSVHNHVLESSFSLGHDDAKCVSHLHYVQFSTKNSNAELQSVMEANNYDSFPYGVDICAFDTIVGDVRFTFEHSVLRVLLCWRNIKDYRSKLR